MGGCGERGVCWSRSIFQLGEVSAVALQGSRVGASLVQRIATTAVSPSSGLPTSSRLLVVGSQQLNIVPVRSGPCGEEGVLWSAASAPRWKVTDLSCSKVGQVRREKSLTGLRVTKTGRGRSPPR